MSFPFIATGYKKMKINVYRLDWTDKGLFGHLLMPGFDCITLERTEMVIPAGCYKAEIYASPHFKCDVLLLKDVPGRSFVEIHWADKENELKGCIALAARRQHVENLDAETFASDNNKETFQRFMALLKDADDIEVVIA